MAFIALLLPGTVLIAGVRVMNHRKIDQPMGEGWDLLLVYSESWQLAALTDALA
jgi:hypothetical protein